MWTCSKCASEVDPGFDVCWNCGTSRAGVEDPAFVTADQAAPIVDPRYDPIAEPDAKADPAVVELIGDAELVACYQAYSLIEAKFLADQLAEAGIPALADTVDMQDALGAMDGQPRVYCRTADLARARSWLEEYEARRRAEGGPVLEG